MAGDPKLVNVVPESLQTQIDAVLLETRLKAARLPAAVAKHVRRQFAGRVFDLAELTRAVEDGRKLVSELTGGQVVQGPDGCTACSTRATGCRRRWMTCWARRATPAWRTAAGPLDRHPRAVPDADRRLRPARRLLSRTGRSWPPRRISPGW